MDVVGFLLGAGADPILEDARGISPFQTAWAPVFTKKCFNETETAMLSLFSDPYLLNKFGLTELHKASSNSSNGSFKGMLLSSSRATIDPIDTWGRSTLSWAAEWGDQKMIQQLLHRGADPNKADELGKTPLHWALGHNSLVSLTTLLSAGAAINRKDHYGRTTLMLSVQLHDDINITRLLLDSGANMTSRDLWGGTVFHYAASADHPRVLTYLLERGGDLNVENYSSHTALEAACSQQSHRALKTLLHHEKLDHTYIKSRTGATILHVAAWFGDLSTFKVFCAARLKGVNVEKQEQYGWTALHLAQWRRDENAKWSKAAYRPPDQDPAACYAAFLEVLDSLVDPVLESSFPRHSRVGLAEAYEAKFEEISELESVL